MQFSTPKTMSPGLPGVIAEGTRPKFVASMIKPMKSGHATAELTIDINTPPAQPFCKSNDKRDSFTLHIIPAEACALPEMKLEYCFPEPLLTGEELLQDIVSQITMDPQLARFGKFWVEDGKIKFRAYQPGFFVDFDIEADPSYVSSSFMINNPMMEGQGKYMAGNVLVRRPGYVREMMPARKGAEEDNCLPYETAFLPTTDLNDPDSTECWAGILMRCESPEAPPALGEWFHFSNCDMDDCVPDSCMSVLEKCSTIWVAPEKPIYQDPKAPCLKLGYRYEVDEANGLTQLGAISMDPTAPGVAPLPVGHTIKGIYNGGKLIKLMLA